jgi:hypothetical protein
MDFNATIDLIIKDLAEAREIIDDLKKYPGVPVLQVELAKAKCKSAGEVIALLKQEERPETEDRRPETEGRRPEEEDGRPKTEDGRRKTEDRRPEEEVRRPKTEDRSLETEVEKPVPVAASRKPQAASPEPEHPVKKPSEGGTIGDSFSHLSNRFNEQLGNRKADDDLSGIIKTKPITSLKEAIGINDRFLFIREIFDGNKDAYTQAISKLENSASISDAQAVIMSYTGASDENDAVRQLLDLVKRKIPSNE